jgi:hypothetical protein
MKLFMALFATLVAQYLPKADVPALAFDADAFINYFNDFSDRPRLVAIFSPT